MSDSEVSVDVDSVVSLRKDIYEEARDSLPAEASSHRLQTCHEHPHRMLEVVPTLELAVGLRILMVCLIKEICAALCLCQFSDAA